MKTALFSIALVSGLAGHSLRAPQDPDGETRRRELESKIEAFLAAETENLDASLQDGEEDLKKFQAEFQRLLEEREALRAELTNMRDALTQQERVRDRERQELEHHLAQVELERERQQQAEQHQREREEFELARLLEEREAETERERREYERQMAEYEAQRAREAEAMEHEYVRALEQRERELAEYEVQRAREAEAMEHEYQRALEERERHLQAAMVEAERERERLEHEYVRALEEAQREQHQVEREQERMREELEREVERARRDMERELERAQRELERAHEEMERAHEAQEQARAQDPVITYGLRYTDGEGRVVGVQDMAQQGFVVTTVAQDDASCRAERRRRVVDRVQLPSPAEWATAVRTPARCLAPCCNGQAPSGGQGITIIVQQGDVHLNAGGAPVNLAAPAGSPVFPGSYGVSGVTTRYLNTGEAPQARPVLMWSTSTAPEADEVECVEECLEECEVECVEDCTEECLEETEETRDEVVLWAPEDLTAENTPHMLAARMNLELDELALAQDTLLALDALVAEDGLLTAGVVDFQPGPGSTEECALMDEITRLQAEIDALSRRLEARQHRQ